MPNNVLILREQKGLTQERFAELCGISRASIARYEAGDEIHRTNAVKIAAACNVSVDFVLGIEPDQAESDDAMVSRIREQIRRDPSYRILYDAIYKTKPDQVRTATAIIKALQPEDSDEPL